MGRGSSKAGSSGGGKAKAQSQYFTPTRSDAVSEKISKAASVKLSKSTITLKDENDKTIGLVRGLERFSDMQFNKQVEANRAMKGSGLDMSVVGQQNIFWSGKQLYIIARPRHSERMKAEYEKAEKAGIIVIKTAVSENIWKKSK